MRVVYDHQIFGSQNYGGISRYYCEIASRLSADPSVDVKIVAPLHRNDFLRGLSTVRVVGCYVPRIPKTGRLRRAVNTAIQDLAIRHDPPDIIHETYYCAGRRYPSTVRTVLTVYDMIHERFPEYFPDDMGDTAAAKKDAIHRADHVICISENTRRDVQEAYGVEPDRVSVIPLGSSLSLSCGEGCSTPSSRPYVLFVGVRHRYKNFGTLLRAYAKSRVSRDVTLVCFGGGPLTRDEQRLVDALRLPRGSVLQDEGDDELLAAYYTHAQALVYPSLYEGFGIPLLEAMSLGCPVVCSAASSFPEVAGLAAEYFNPNDDDSIAQALERVVYSPSVREELIARGLERAQHFTWDGCVQKVRDAYRRVLCGRI